jgi:protein required for attachment to host cells
MDQKKKCIVVADGARARFFAFPDETRTDGPPDRMVEIKDLVCPTRREHASNLHSDSRPGIQGSVGARHGVDDHRQAHRQEEERRFATDIAEAIAESCRDRGLILFAASSLLGHLRPVLARQPGFDVDGSLIVEQALDLSKLTPSELHDRLAKDGFLPARRVVRDFQRR